MFSRASRTDFRPSPSIVRVVAMRSGSRWPNNSSPRGARGHRPEGARGASQGRRRHVQRRRRHQGHGEWRRRRASRRPSSRRIATSDVGHQVTARHAQALTVAALDGAAVGGGLAVALGYMKRNLNLAQHRINRDRHRSRSAPTDQGDGDRGPSPGRTSVRGEAACFVHGTVMACSRRIGAIASLSRPCT